MTKLLYLSVRPEEGAAAAEHVSFARALGRHVDRLDLLTARLDPGLIERSAGFVVGGSPFNVSDSEISDVQRRVEADLERLAEAAIAGEVPAFFTCYGIGVVTRMLGGTLTLEHAEEAGAVWIETTEDAASDPLFGAAPRGFHALSAHKEAASAAPTDAVLLASGDRCPVQAYRVGTSLWATQFHPEPTPADFAERMGYYRGAGYFADFERARQAVLAASLTEPARLLGRFAELAAA